MNNRFLVIATLSGTNFDDNEVWTNQWKVGTFEQLETCYFESQLDLEKTLTDGFEGRFEDEDEENGEEELTKLVKGTMNSVWKTDRRENELRLFEPEHILSIQYDPDDFSRIELNYLVIRIKD